MSVFPAFYFLLHFFCFSRHSGKRHESIFGRRDGVVLDGPSHPLPAKYSDRSLVCDAVDADADASPSKRPNCE
jgi:hypothetical protein